MAKGAPAKKTAKVAKAAAAAGTKKKHTKRTEVRGLQKPGLGMPPPPPHDLFTTRRLTCLRIVLAELLQLHLQGAEAGPPR